jgi:hypothetical protein
MSQSLGTLYVDLQAQTGGFVSALSKAAASAQSAARQISREFSDLQSIASQTFGAFGGFNPAISKIGFALSAAGSAASSMMKEMSGMSGAIGPIAALSTGAATGLAAMAIGAAGIASHAAESAAKMYELAQSTGVNIETLSGFSFLAKTVGVDTQTLAMGLERMSKSAFAAATAPAGATNAYTRLGVAVRDAAGNIRPADAILLDLADKFSKMPDGVEKSADAIAIFGRSGDLMIPFLNKGKEGIREFNDYVKQVGAALTGPEGKAAEDYSLALAKIGIAASAAEKQLMVAMLPTLQNMADMLAQTAANGSSWAQNLGESMALIIKFGASAVASFLMFADEIGMFFQFVGGLLLGTLELIGSVVTATMHALTFDFSGARKELTAGLDSFTSTFTDFFHDQKQDWSVYSEFMNGVWAKAKPPSNDVFGGKPFGFFTSFKPPPKPEASTGSGRPDVVSELIGKLQAQAAAELALASATEKSAAASVLAKAAAEAETQIAELRVRLLAQEKALRAEMGNAQKEGAAGQSAGGERAVRLQGEIAGVQATLAELQKDAPQIKALHAEMAAGEFGAKASKDLEEFITKTNEETVAARNMAAAFSQGPLAAQQAIGAAKLAPFEKQRDDLLQLINLSKQAGMPPAALGSLQTSYDQISAAIERAKTAEADFTSAEISQKVAKEVFDLQSEAAAYDVVAGAALKSAAAQREAAARAETIKFAAANPTATAPELGDVYGTALAKLQEQHAETIAQEAAQQDLNVQYDRELEKLQEIRSFLQSSGESTMAIDASIAAARTQYIEEYQEQVIAAQNTELLGNARLYDSQQQLIAQWDQAALKVGTLSERLGAFFSMAQQQGANLGEKVFGSFSKALDDLSTQLSDWVVTGKAKFGDLVKSLEESLLKATFQKTFSMVAGNLSAALGLPTPQQQLGTAGNPMFVRFAQGLTTGLPGSGDLSAGTGPLPITPQGSNAINPIFALDGLSSSTSSSGAPKQASSGIISFLSKMFTPGGGFGSAGRVGATPPFFPGPAYGPPGSSSSSGGGGIGGLIGGMGKPQGTAASPFYVVLSAAPGAAPGGSSSTSLGGSFGLPGGSSGGSFGSADGSQSNPWYVIPTDTLGNALGNGGGFGTMFGGSTDAGGGDGASAAASAASLAAASALTGSAKDLTSSGGSLGSSAMLLDMSAVALTAAAIAQKLSQAGGAIAGMESGGDVTAGKAYIVGEKRPEVFVPREHGRIVPSIPEFSKSISSAANSNFSFDAGDSKQSFSSRSIANSSAFANSTLLRALPRREYGGNVMAGNAYLAGESRAEVFVPNSAHSSRSAGPGAGESSPTHVLNMGGFHVHGVENHDSFRKSHSQIMADMRGELDRAFYRNR